MTGFLARARAMLKKLVILALCVPFPIVATKNIVEAIMTNQHLYTTPLSWHVALIVGPILIASYHIKKLNKENGGQGE